MMTRPVLCLVTPALAAANNGNWQTAHRWSRMLAADYQVLVQPQWDGSAADVMVALHARRSADSIAGWARQHPQRPLAVVLTGTDLYRDILVDTAAQASLQLAQRLIVLHERAALDLPVALRDKCRVCLQSAAARAPRVKPTGVLRCLMVGHLRDEKSPRTYFEAVRALAARSDIHFDHIGAALDADLGAQALALQREQARYRWLGELDHGATRSRIQRAHVLVHASRIEGGAHVVIEAVRSGTPVLASRIAGNVGLLGADYEGYFEPGDSAALARALERCRDDAAMLDALRLQCERRAPLFDPARERATLRQVVAEMRTERNARRRFA